MLARLLGLYLGTPTVSTGAACMYASHHVAHGLSGDEFGANKSTVHRKTLVLIPSLQRWNLFQDPLWSLLSLLSSCEVPNTASLSQFPRVQEV